MDVEVISTSERLRELVDAWTALQARSSHPSIYTSHRFVSAWWDAYRDAESHTLHTLGVWHNGDLVAIAPLVIVRAKIGKALVRTLQWSSHGDYLGVLMAPEFSTKASRELLAFIHNGDQWDRTLLGGMRIDTPFAHYLLRSEHNPSFTPHVECPYVDLREYADFDDFCARALPTHTRKYRNKFFREHDVQFTVYAGGHNDLLQRIGAVHVAERDYLRASLDRSERHSLFEDPRRVAHLSQVYASGSDTLTFTYEYPDRTIAAYRTCFVDGSTLLSWNSAYAPQVASYRLGKVMQFDIFQHLFERGGLDIFDFGAGRYPWKFEWTHRFRATYRYRHGAERSPRASTPAAKKAVDQPTPPVPVTPPLTPANLPSAAARRARRVIDEARNSVRARRQPPVIWYVPHPDDETISMGGGIAARSDRRHLLVLLTHGGASAALAKVNARLLLPISRADFMAARVREFTAAARELGVARRDISHPGLIDGEIKPEDVLLIIAAMARQHPGAEHRTMSYLDPHADHAAAGRALREAAWLGVIKFCEFHLPPPLMDGPGGQRAPLSVRALSRKRAALDAYQVWEPSKGRYSIGGLSVPAAINTQRLYPRERTHGLDVVSIEDAAPPT